MDFGDFFGGSGGGGIGGSIVGGLFSTKQQKRGFNQSRELQRIANEFTRESQELQHEFASEEAKRARDFSAQQVANQLGFQERMSSTQHQRAADDLNRAGLNRILALGRPAVAPPGASAQGIAASGVGGSGTGGSPGPSGEGISPGMRAGIEMASARQMIRTQEAQEQNIRAQTRGVNATTAIKELASTPAEVIRDAFGDAGTTGQRVMERLQDLWQRIQDDRERIKTIEIKRGKHPNDRKHNWQDIKSAY